MLLVRIGIDQQLAVGVHCDHGLNASSVVRIHNGISDVSKIIGFNFKCLDNRPGLRLAERFVAREDFATRVERRSKCCKFESKIPV